MKVSIITINYNNLEGLKKTIPSVIHQRYTQIEFIVIDGGSSDGSKTFIEKQTSNITYWISEPDKGIYDAMNKGIEKATGDYLYFLNSGDYFYNEHVLTDLCDHQPDADIICGKIVFKSQHKERIGGHPEEVRMSQLYHSFFCHQAVFFKKRLFDEMGGYDERFKLIADWAFISLAFTKFNASYKYYEDVVIAYYDTTGISSDGEKAERQIQLDKALFFNTYFPFLKKDMEELQELRVLDKRFKSRPRLYNLFIWLLTILEKKV
ncbi:glycosyltransferase family 2 protein [Formosa sp. S-31]|uniref:glycosyltransferase family 2 protein n=1 Tax=Formosa sp. S-31 TaxID=2790949 RepID=UPI003EC14BC0